MRINCVLPAALILAAATPLPAQERDRPHETPYGPDGPFLVEMSSVSTIWTSALPESYLEQLTARTLDRDHSLSSGNGYSIRLGMRVAERWIVKGEHSWLDTKFGLANVDIALREWGGAVHYLLSPGVDLSAGAGTVRYVPDGADAHTDLRLTLGSGGGFGLFGPVDVRLQVEYSASWFSPPGTDGGLAHEWSTGAGLALSLP
ncbi:MAG: hypothetical protein Q8W44_13460 [Candidatus Palauibacterales bacterium]|nr:hypothetical protein [Candidatus Palauibacterales bacterium]